MSGVRSTTVVCESVSNKHHQSSFLPAFPTPWVAVSDQLCVLASFCVVCTYFVAEVIVSVAKPVPGQVLCASLTSLTFSDMLHTSLSSILASCHP